MSTERPSFGFRSFLPQNYRTRVEDFAHCLQDKLNSLTGNDDKVVSNGTERLNSEANAGVKQFNDGKDVTAFPFDPTKFSEENIFVQHPGRLYKPSFEPKTVDPLSQNGKLKFLQKNGGTIHDRRGYSSDSEDSEDEARADVNGSATSELVLNSHRQSELLHKKVQQLINGSDEPTNGNHKRLASQHSEDSFCSCEDEPFESDEDDTTDYFASQIKGSPRIRNPKLRGRGRFRGETWQKNEIDSPDVFDVECFSPVNYEDAEDFEHVPLNQIEPDSHLFLDIENYDVPHRILRGSSSEGNLEAHFSKKNGCTDLERLMSPDAVPSSLTTPPPSPEIFKEEIITAIPEPEPEPIRFAEISQLEEDYSLEVVKEPKTDNFCSTFVKVNNMVLECPCEPKLWISEAVVLGGEEDEESSDDYENEDAEETSSQDEYSPVVEVEFPLHEDPEGCATEEVASSELAIENKIEQNTIREVDPVESAIEQSIDSEPHTTEVESAESEIGNNTLQNRGTETESMGLEVEENIEPEQHAVAEVESPESVIEGSTEPITSEEVESIPDTEKSKLTIDDDNGEEDDETVPSEAAEQTEAQPTPETKVEPNSQSENENVKIVVVKPVDEGKNDEEDVDNPRMKLRRCSSLKTWKTPPGTPGSKKIVRFADALGLDLADVRTFLDEIPKVPSSAFEDLQCDNASLRMTPLPPVMPTLIPMFPQPGGQIDFLERVRRDNVCLENAVLTDTTVLTVSGCIRVRNLNYNKSVHVRYSIDRWQTFSDLQATYVPNSCDGFSDKFSFVLYGHTLKIGEQLEFALRLECHGCQYWDNNAGANYIFQCLPQCPSNSIYTPLNEAPADPGWSKLFY